MLKAHRLLVGVILAVTALAIFAGWLIALNPFTWHYGGVTDAGLQKVVVVGDIVYVTVAATESTRQQGLGGREGLARNEGMLFVFDRDGRYSFWMKDMSFSIDIVWLSADGHVVYIEPSVSPDTYPAAFTPDAPARYVLELPAGYMAAHHVKVGDVVQL